MAVPSNEYAVIPPIRTVRALAVSILLTPIILGLVVVLAVPTGAYPPPVLPLILGAVAVGGVLLAETAGFAAPPIKPGTPPELAARTAVQYYRTRWFVRSVSTEIVLLIGLLLSFMLATRWPYLVAFVLGWPIMIFEVWPWRRATQQLNRRLEFAGARSYLDEALHGRRPGSSG